MYKICVEVEVCITSNRFFRACCIKSLLDSDMHVRSIVFSMYELLIIANKCFSEVTPGSLWILLRLRYIYSPKNTGNTQEAVAPSRHDCKIIDWDVKHQHKRTNGIYMLGESRDPTLTICLDNRKLTYQRLFLSASVTK